MAIYSCKVRGEEKHRLVRADTAAQARDHIVSAKPLSAEDLADEIEKGGKVEKAGEEPATTATQNTAEKNG